MCSEALLESSSFVLHSAKYGPLEYDIKIDSSSINVANAALFSEAVASGSQYREDVAHVATWCVFSEAGAVGVRHQEAADLDRRGGR